MYKTGFLKVKTQILETIFAELPQTAKKVKLTIKFDDEEKLNTFKRLEAQRKDDEEDCVSLDSESEFESQEDEGPFMDPMQLKDELNGNEKLMAKKDNAMKIRQQKIGISLEQGIIYKQFYEKSFQKIGQSFNVKIKIRAQKITFEGYQIDDIEDAMEQVNELRSHIEIQYIPKSGLEMSQSIIIKQKLDKVGVKLFRILDKYYRWYEISPKLSPDEKKDKRTAVKKVLTDIDKFIHCLQYLNSIDQDIDMIKGSRGTDFFKLQHNFMNYRPLQEQLKAKVFLKQLSQKINGEMGEDYLEAELSISEDALIFHSFAKELLEMTIKEVRVQFQAYDYFYITIDSDHPIEQAIQILKKYEYDAIMQSSKVKPVIGQIEQVKQINFIHFTTNYEKVKESIEVKMKAPTYFGDYIPKESVIFCIGFRKKNSQRRLQFLFQILQKLNSIWMGASYKISIGLQQEEDLEDNSISYEYNKIEKIFSISANQNSLETNLSILRNYVIGKKMQQKRTQLLNLEDNNISLSTINTSQFINESTYLNQKSITQDLNSSNILDAVRNDLPNENEIQGQEQDEKQIQLLKQYRVFLPETSKEYNEKYNDSKVKQNQITQTDKRNRSLEEQLFKATDSTFQVLKVKVSPKHKVESFYENPQRDQIVTIFISKRVSPFVKPKELGLKIEQGLNQTFPIRFLSKRQPISQSGYLLNIKKKSIQVHGKSYKVKYGAEFQVAKAITYLKK